MLASRPIRFNNEGLLGSPSTSRRECLRGFGARTIKITARQVGECATRLPLSTPKLQSMFLMKALSSCAGRVHHGSFVQKVTLGQMCRDAFKVH